MRNICAKFHSITPISRFSTLRSPTLAAFSKLFFDFLKTLKNNLLGFAMQQEPCEMMYEYPLQNDTRIPLVK